MVVACIFAFESKNRRRDRVSSDLSREIGAEKEARYPYSYAKYKNGVLVDSKGILVIPVLWNVSGRSSTPGL